eukprot:2295100-Amphidinium_carterae.1
MEGIEFAEAEEEDEPAENAEGENEGEEEQAEEPRAKMPRTEMTSIPLAPGIKWEPDWKMGTRLETTCCRAPSL